MQTEWINPWIEISKVFNSRDLSLFVCNLIEERYYTLIESKKPFVKIGSEDHEALALNMAFLSANHALIVLTRDQLFQLRNPRSTPSEPTKQRSLVDVTYEEVLRHYANMRRVSYSAFIGEMGREIMVAAWRSVSFIRLLNPDYAKRMDESWNSCHALCPPDMDFELESLYRMTATAQAMLKYFELVGTGKILKAVGDSVKPKLLDKTT